MLCDFVSEYQAEELKHDVYLTDRAKTNNRAVLNNIDTINRAMSRRLDGHPHQPEQIAFKYLKHEIKNVGETVERRKGKEYIVNPYALIINDGNYYMLVYDESIKKGVPSEYIVWTECVMSVLPVRQEKAQSISAPLI